MSDSVSPTSTPHQSSSIDERKPVEFEHKSPLKNVEPVRKYMTAMSSHAGEIGMSVPNSSVAISAISSEAKSLIPGFWFQLAKATPEQFKSQAILSRGSTPDQLIGHLVDDNNNIIHFSFEKISAKTSETLTDLLNSMQYYQRSIVSVLSNYVDTEGKIDNFNEPPNTAYYSKVSARNILNEIIKKKNINPDSAFDLYYQIEEIDEGAGVFQVNQQQAEDRYVVYASSRSLKDFSLEVLAKSNYLTKDNSIEDYIRKYGHIIACVGSGLQQNCIEHRGIFKTPQAIMNSIKCNFKNQDIPCGGLSMALNFFGMKCAQTLKAELLTLSPIKVMEEIFIKVMDSEIKNNQVAVGHEKIIRMGWSHHLRNQDNEENPVELVLNDNTAKLWL